MNHLPAQQRYLDLHAVNRYWGMLAHSLAIGLPALINALNLPMCRTGGGVCEAWKLFAPVIFEELYRRSDFDRLTVPDDRSRAIFEPRKTRAIHFAEFDPAAALLIACLLPSTTAS